MNVPFDVAVGAMRATVCEGVLAPRSLHVVTDTRSIERGDTFLALRGERFDGHDFIGEAVKRGASCIIIDNAAARPDDVTTLIVSDGLDAYMALAQKARERFTGRVLAITGSAGKTTTKVFSTQLLAARYGDRVAAAPGNENNEIGVAKLLLSLSNELHDVVVVEMGARHFGDIATLTRMADPHVGVLTNIGDAHLEIMGSPERLAETKWSIFQTGARAVINASDEVSIRRAPLLDRAPHWFFAGGAGDVIPSHPRMTAVMGDHRLIELDGQHRTEHAVAARVPGLHNHANLAAAIAAAREMDVGIAAMQPMLERLTLPTGRYERMVIGNMAVIYDAYNANAAGMIAALEAFASERAVRRIALLSSMAELGAESAALHRRVGDYAARSNIDIALFGGEFADAMAEGARNAGFPSERIVRFATNSEAVTWLRENAREGDVVLLKGSRKYALEEIVVELRG